MIPSDRNVSQSREAAMAQVVVLYGTPKDAGAFDKYYSERHVAIAKKIPGLRKYEVSQGPVAAPTGPSDFHLIAILQFDDMAAIQKGFASPEGQAAAGDLQAFAPGGANIILCDSRVV